MARLRKLAELVFAAAVASSLAPKGSPMRQRKIDYKGLRNNLAVFHFL